MAVSVEPRNRTIGIRDDLYKVVARLADRETRSYAGQLNFLLEKLFREMGELDE